MPRNASGPLRIFVAVGVLFAGMGAGGQPETAVPAAAVSPVHAPDSIRTERPTRIYFGMWSLHVRNVAGGVEFNRLLGVAHRGYYAAVFRNSFGDRSFSMGIQRPAAFRIAEWAPAVGFRAGVVTGYDERFIDLAAKTPILPLLQLTGVVDVGRFGMELAWNGLTTALAMSVRP